MKTRRNLIAATAVMALLAGCTTNPYTGEQQAGKAGIYGGIGAVTGAVIGAADTCHIAAHGTVRPDNPLFSSLLLDDGPYTVFDLEQLGATLELGTNKDGAERRTGQRT